MYEAFFRLTGKPFQLNPDPDFFYGSRGHRRAMAYLEYGLHQGEGFIVITGEVGAGKTTLVRNLLRRVPSDSVQAAQIVSTQVGADDLLRLVAGSFQIDVAGLDKSGLLQRLEEHFRAMHRAGRRALLVVDEAQNLSPRAVEELRMLSNFQEGTRSLVQSFLVGQPEFRAILQRPEMRQLKQRIIASYHLGPLDSTETRAYVEHRLRHVGWRGDPDFSPDSLAQVHAVAEGVPRRINTLCDRVLLAAFLAERHDIDRDLIEDVAAELADELGGPAAGPVLAVVPSGAPDEPVGSTGGDREADAAGGSTSAAARIALLEARLARLEASSATTYNVLQRVLRVLRASTGALGVHRATPSDGDARRADAGNPPVRAVR
ncbi:MAG: XrtA/PEP-CTERM system-associated ATPase [Burkholderiales bacterium]